MTATLTGDGLAREFTRHDVWRMCHRETAPTLTDGDRRTRVGLLNVRGTLWERARDAALPETPAACRACYGVGAIHYDAGYDRLPIWEPCVRCHGEGREPYTPTDPRLLAGSTHRTERDLT